MIQITISEIEKVSPSLFLYGAATVFRKQYKFPIKRVTSFQEVRDLVGQYTGVSTLDYQLVIEDLFLLNGMAILTLLKLVEDSRFPVVVLSSYDCVDPILLSRFKTVYKFVDGEITK